MLDTFEISQPSTAQLGQSSETSGQKAIGGRYQILQKLAKRQRRLTFLARDLKTQELVVIKLLSFNHELQLNELRAVQQEIETLKRLSHPAIPHYLEHFDVELRNGNKGLAIVQEYVAARSLQSYLSAGRVFNESEVKQIAKAVLQILIYLHQLKPPVIHRDITPDNLLLLESPQQGIGKVFLIDFGSVEEFASHENTTSASTIGTFGFMPPEQFGGRVMPASDLYSLGITLITLLTGTPPSQMPRKNLRIRFEDQVQLSAALTDWLKWMTEPLVENRLTSAWEALDALEQGRQRQLLTPEVVIPKPLGCRALLHKTLSSCEVVIPPAGFTPVIKAFMACSIGLLVVTLTGVILATQLSGALKFLALFLPLPLGAIGVYFLLAAYFTAKGRIRLRLSHREISLIYELFRWKFTRPPSAPLKQVSKLRYVKPNSGNAVKIHPCLVLQAKKYKYQLGTTPLFDLANRLKLTNDPRGFSTLAEPDLEWLAQEISRWSGLPISDL